MSVVITVPILFSDRLTTTGRVYSKEVLENIVKKFKENNLGFGMIGMGELTHTPIKDIALSYSDLKVKDDALYAKIKLLDTFKPL